MSLRAMFQSKYTAPDQFRNISEACETSRNFRHFCKTPKFHSSDLLSSGNGAVFTVDPEFIPNNADEFEAPCMLRAHPRKEKLVKAYAKFHSTSNRKFLREVELFHRLGPSKYVLQPRDSTFLNERTSVPNLLRQYYVNIYESADYDFTDLQRLIHEDGIVGMKIIKYKPMRQAVKGIFRALKHFHNHGYIHGAVDEKAIRFNLVDGNIHIKLTNYGTAKRVKKDAAKVNVRVPLNDPVVKAEVQQLGNLIKKLLPNLSNRAALSGHCHMLFCLLRAMTTVSPNLASVPSLELIETSLFMLSPHKQLQYIMTASMSLQSDKYLAGVAVRKLDLTHSGGWRNTLPDYAVSYIQRCSTDDADRKRFKKDSVTYLVLACDDNLKSVSADLSADIRDLQSNKKLSAGLQTFRLAFKVQSGKHWKPNECTYNPTLLDHNRMIRNFYAHCFSGVEFNAIMSVKGFLPGMLVEHQLEAVAQYGQELQTLMYALNHEGLVGIQSLAGNHDLIAMGGGTLYGIAAKNFRSGETLGELDLFRDRIVKAINNISDRPTPNESEWPSRMPREYPRIMEMLHEVNIEGDNLNESSSSGDYSSDGDEANANEDDDETAEGAVGGAAAGPAYNVDDEEW